MLVPTFRVSMHLEKDVTVCADDEYDGEVTRDLNTGADGQTTADGPAAAEDGDVTSSSVRMVFHTAGAVTAAAAVLSAVL